MVNNEIQTTLDSPIQTTVESPIKTMLDSTMNQAVPAVIREPNKIGGCTPYDFDARKLTAYGGLLPVATMLENLGFQQLVDETVTLKRRTRAMPVYRFVLGWCWPAISASRA
jgi:hypothetical protein